MWKGCGSVSAASAASAAAVARRRLSTAASLLLELPSSSTSRVHVHGRAKWNAPGFKRSVATALAAAAAAAAAAATVGSSSSPDNPRRPPATTTTAATTAITSAATSITPANSNNSTTTTASPHYADSDAQAVFDAVFERFNDPTRSPMLPPPSLPDEVLRRVAVNKPGFDALQYVRERWLAEIPDCLTVFMNFYLVARLSQMKTLNEKQFRADWAVYERTQTTVSRRFIMDAATSAGIMYLALPQSRFRIPITAVLGVCVWALENHHADRRVVAQLTMMSEWPLACEMRQAARAVLPDNPLLRIFDRMHPDRDRDAPMFRLSSVPSPRSLEMAIQLLVLAGALTLADKQELADTLITGDSSGSSARSIQQQQRQQAQQQAQQQQMTMVATTSSTIASHGRESTSLRSSQPPHRLTFNDRMDDDDDDDDPFGEREVAPARVRSRTSPRSVSSTESAESRNRPRRVRDPVTLEWVTVDGASSSSSLSSSRSRSSRSREFDWDDESDV